MNAHERIAEVICKQIHGDARNSEAYLPAADAVLTVLPDLLTDPETVDAAIIASNLMETPYIGRATVEDILAAATKALAEDPPRPAEHWSE